MPTPILDAVAVAMTDMARTMSFYRLLGFDFEGDGAFISEEHVEPVRMPGAPRLMIDAAELMEKLTGQAPKPATHSAFAMLCESPSEVDRIAAEISAAGFEVKTAPWDAFWGQRYATIADPDGYLVDLFAALP